MRRMRFLALGIVSFVVAIVGTLLAPGTFVNRAFSAALCTLFSFNWTVCTVDLGGSSQRVVAANPPAVVADISNYLQAQRDPSEFGDEPSAPSPQQSNPQAPPFPQDPGPNFPVRREFDGSDTNSIPAVVNEFTGNSNFQDLQPGTHRFIDTKGCEQIAEIKSNGNKKYVESAVLHLANDGISCSSGAFEILAKYAADGNSVTLTAKNNNPPIVVQGLRENTWQISYTDQTGVQKKERFSFGDISYTQNIFISQFTKNINDCNNKDVTQNSVDLVKKINISEANSKCREERDYCRKLKVAADLIKLKIPELGELLSNPLTYWFAGSGATLISKIPPNISLTFLITWSIMAFQDANYCFYYYGEIGGYHTDMLISALKIGGRTQEEATNRIEQVASANRIKAEERCNGPLPRFPVYPPKQTAVTARISQIDDVATIFIDGRKAKEGGYAGGGKGGDTGWGPLEVSSGTHQVRLVVNNTIAGQSGGWFEIKVNGELKINQGRRFQDDRVTGIKYDETTTLEVP
ncbi:hypothetical protein H6S82_15220 [Planktothrix sp. FACHB-1355]|uniref:Uncharacterized protein n=1 Tax=Aerosakkonema funiforme FACHB-1375 TaxID=2949571 RepID=A0A926VAR2_9CYAN|nr:MULTISPECIES: hypothetical protein [Oscillatoriales]MBD2180220.1 hypothetical protein [Aerosakkonema funiforme FACHB-1375]MBD3560194.1 hypothetical protein [Planktothrix sp. FACHB-1355]